MSSKQAIHPHLLRLAGISGICVGFFILSFAILAESKGIFLSSDVYSASIETWIRRIQENPSLARFIMVLPSAGFSSMLIVGIVLYQYISINSWQKNLAISGYLIGVSLAVFTFVSQFSTINQALLLLAERPGMSDQIHLILSFKMSQFMTVNAFFGPFFILIVGTPFMSWAALKSHALPGWLCYWGIFTGVLMTSSFLYKLIPVMEYAGVAAPLHMLWFLMVGIFLFRKSLMSNLIDNA